MELAKGEGLGSGPDQAMIGGLVTFGPAGVFPAHVPATGLTLCLVRLILAPLGHGAQLRSFLAILRACAVLQARAPRPDGATNNARY